MPGPGMGRGPMPRGMKPTVKNPGKILKRLIKYMVLDNLVLWILVAACIGITVYCMTVKGTLFTRTLIDIYIPGIREGKLTLFLQVFWRASYRPGSWSGSHRDSRESSGMTCLNTWNHFRSDFLILIRTVISCRFIRMTSIP